MDRDLDEAVQCACRERTLLDALTWIAAWETEQIVRRNIRRRYIAVESIWPAFFEESFDHVILEWRKTHPEDLVARLLRVKEER